MPVRLVDDEPEEEQNDNSGGDDSGRGGGGGFPGGGGMLSMLLPLLFRYPKLLLVGLVLFGGYYLFENGCGGGGGNERNRSSDASSLSTGMKMKEDVFDKAKVFEPLSANAPMPAAVDLEPYCPERSNQGRQGSCVGWASTYAARTILQAQATGVNPNSTIFSPSFVYNQIHLENCQGSYMLDALKTLQAGSVTLQEFPYNDQDCDRQPNSALKERATQNRITGFNRLTEGGEDYGIDIQGIKQNLAQGAPVVIGAMVTESFQYMRGNRCWKPESGDRPLGGHAMCVVGYDDNKEGGAFKIMNSWGKDWGDRGFGWVRYREFKGFCKEAYGLHPLPRKQSDGKFDVKIGLVDNASKGYIPLSLKSPNLFTSQPVAKNMRFKIEVNNSIECYTYVFGQETDNSSYVLFPYTPKFSPFCGITGSRLFPKGKSLSPDATGSKDYMAIVVTKKELDYETLNKKVSASKGDYLAAFKAALGGSMASKVNFKTENGGVMHFTAEDKEDDAAVVIVVEINKR